MGTSNSIKKNYTIDAPIEKVWQALTTPKLIDKWGAGPSKMSVKTEEFSLWGGDIHGKNTKVVKEKTLEQDWYAGNWKEPSKLKINLSEKGEKTKVDLTHTGVPEGEIKEIDGGWDQYYFGPLKKLVESGDKH